jgi:hypothetical protein
MKKLITLFLFVSFSSFAQLQIINFTDLNFKNKLLQSNGSNNIARGLNSSGIEVSIKIDSDNDGTIRRYEALQVLKLDVHSSNITDLTGIEYFTNLRNLTIDSNSINNPNISALSQLKILYCSSNTMSSLNLSGLTALELLDISINNFSSFDFSGLPNLKKAYCLFNHFTTLDFSNNPLFVELTCSYNNLSSINIKNGSTQLLTTGTFSSDCWNVNNPNLMQICADANEVVPLQTFLATCTGTQPNVDSSCPLAVDGFVENQVTVSPNPATSTINVHFNDNSNDNDNSNMKMMQLLDVQGRVLTTQEVAGISATFDVSGYDNGVYFIKITTKNKSSFTKIIKN